MKNGENLFFYINVDHGNIRDILSIFSMEIDSDLVHAQKLFNRNFKLEKQHIRMEVKIIQDLSGKIPLLTINRISNDHKKIIELYIKINSFFEKNLSQIKISGLKGSLNLISLKKEVFSLKDIQKKHIDYEDKYFYPLVVKKINPLLRDDCIKEIKARI